MFILTGITSEEDAEIQRLVKSIAEILNSLVTITQQHSSPFEFSFFIIR